MGFNIPYEKWFLKEKPMEFQFEKLESTASPLYQVTATDNGVFVMRWNIACNDESQLEALAIEAYHEVTTPKTYEGA